MNIYLFDGEDLKVMLVGCANLLGESKAEIDALNVFPVPDGDTGSNMYLTLLAGVKEAQQVNSGNIGEVAGAAARGCLYGARGNSGVILSQVMQGFASALNGIEQAGAKDVARAFKQGYEAAVKAVSEPVEGTMLTVCREIANAYEEISARYSDLVRITVQVYRHAEAALQRTPEQLPVLKEAGVVDAGGKGIVNIIYGIIRALRDRAAQKDVQLFDLAASQQKEFVANRLQDYGSHLEHTYCTEFLIQGYQIPLDVLREELVPYGDCLLVVGDMSTAKVHVHTNHPGLVLECGLKYGTLQSVNVNNMEEQNQELKAANKKEESKQVAIVAVGVGEGISTVLESMGVDTVLNGGQTMNPSAEDFLHCIQDSPGEEVILLPNNKNIIMAAEQAAEMAEKNTAVIPTASIPQGIAALLGYNPVENMLENLARMQGSFCDVISGEVTRAVRDSSAGGKTIVEGQLIALAEGEIKAYGDDLAGVTAGMIDAVADPDGAMVTMFFGAGLSGEEAETVRKQLQERFPEIDFELYYGGQPVYYFIISVE